MMSLYRERLSSPSLVAPELVLLHGWGSSSAIWRSLLPQLRPHFNITLVDLPGFGASSGLDAFSDADSLLTFLLPSLPKRAIYLGWSLGGMLAARLAASYPDRVQALVAVASNARFVASDDWPQAMAAESYRHFAALVAEDPLKGLKRFRMLQVHGDPNARTLLKQLAAVGDGETLEARSMMSGLQCLVSMDNRRALEKIAVPVLHLFAEQDAVVPARAAEAFRESYPSHCVELVENSGHIPFLSSPDDFFRLLLHFLGANGFLLNTTPRQFSKQAVARSFSQAATSYDSVASLQRRVADRLLSLLPEDLGRTADLGCGTGYSLPALRQRGGMSDILAVDIAEGMLSYARQRHPGDADIWLAADAEDLPLADASIDTVFSSLSLQWCENFNAVALELERVLKPGGHAVIATLGPDTLKELRCAWDQVDGYVHVNRFYDRDVVEAAFAAAGLHVQNWQSAEEVLVYPKLSDLTRELKKLGAHNVNEGRPGGLTGRRRLQQLTAAYEDFRRNDNQLPATYQVWYLRLIKT